MSGALTLLPGVTLAAIGASATSIRLHTTTPTTYATAVSSAIGIYSFAAGSLFSPVVNDDLHCGQIAEEPQVAGLGIVVGISFVALGVPLLASRLTNRRLRHFLLPDLNTKRQTTIWFSPIY
jgi:hypothetical protein